MMEVPLDKAIEEAKRSLQKALEDSNAPGKNQSEGQSKVSIRVETAGNVAQSIHIEQQTLSLGNN